MSHNRDSSLDQLAEHEQCSLNSALHWAHDNQADIEVLGDAGNKLLANLAALLPAEFGHLRVMEAVVLWGELARSKVKA